MKLRADSSPQVLWAKPRLSALPNHPDAVELAPKLPPGRATRKALAFAAEIHRLRAAGYSFEAIRQALRDAGVIVSSSTVKREAAKPLASAPSAPSIQTAPRPTACAPALHQARQTVTAPSPSPYTGDPRSGRQIADSFMQGRVTNPLMQETPAHENRRD
ncbi:hypothetical protein [Rubrivivax albus]|uniref:Uncharacterized protein n=1 Tax=Rubrivivax albus TaxID=2499835 RepID=A0A3S2UN26_9BURK|nr:hypothetical protein [Rubrivivax albus]RVT49587.1 hypothetical protein ENE75_18180 [Rubrivivax albus]